MSINTSITGFNLALQRFGKDTVPSLQRARVTVIALEGAKRLAEYTPVDRGRLKGNWQFTIGEPAEGEIDRIDDSAEGTPSNELQRDTLQGMAKWEPGEWIWFHNGVTYAAYVNDGTERTDPRHMIERTVDDLNRWLRSN